MVDERIIVVEIANGLVVAVMDATSVVDDEPLDNEVCGVEVVFIAAVDVLVDEDAIVAVMVECVLSSASFRPEHNPYAAATVFSSAGHFEATQRSAPSPTVYPLVLFFEHKQSRSPGSEQTSVGNPSARNDAKQCWAQVGMDFNISVGRLPGEDWGRARAFAAGTAVYSRHRRRIGDMLDKKSMPQLALGRYEISLSKWKGILTTLQKDTDLQKTKLGGEDRVLKHQADQQLGRKEEITARKVVRALMRNTEIV